jgi:hypothetical protein
MLCKPNSPAVRRYNRRIFIATAAYLVTLLSTALIIKHLHPAHAVAVVLAIIPAIPIAATIAIVGLYLKEEKDEFQRELLIQALLWATAFTLTTTSTWGLLEIYAEVAPLTSFYVFVLFWFFFGMAMIPLRMRYRTGRDD